MGLFDFIFKKNATVSMRFIQSDNYRGFKKFALVNYGHKESEKGLKKLHSKTKNFDLKGMEIEIRDFVYDNNKHGVAVYVDDCQVGSYFDNGDFDLAAQLRAHRISAAYVRIDTIKNMGKERFAALLFVRLEAK